MKVLQSQGVNGELRTCGKMEGAYIPRVMTRRADQERSILGTELEEVARGLGETLHA